MSLKSSHSFIEECDDKTMFSLDRLFKSKGEIKSIDYRLLNYFSHEQVRYYCLINGIYGIVTDQLVSFLKDLIKDKSTIEIGSGNGTLGRALGINMTDNYLQKTNRQVMLMYKMMCQPTIDYPADVENIEALDAIKKYTPQIVIGSWITHKFNPDQPEMEGNILGVDTLKLLEMGVEKYILYGNIEQHKNDPIFRKSNIDIQVIQEPFMKSRSMYDSQNALFIFNSNENHGI